MTEQEEIAALKTRIERLEDVTENTIRALRGVIRRESEINDAIRRFDNFSFEKIIATIEHAIAAYRSSRKFEKEVDTLVENLTDDIATLQNP